MTLMSDKNVVRILTALDVGVMMDWGHQTGVGGSWWTRREIAEQVGVTKNSNVAQKLREMCSAGLIAAQKGQDFAGRVTWFYAAVYTAQIISANDADEFIDSCNAVGARCFEVARYRASDADTFLVLAVPLAQLIEVVTEFGYREIAAARGARALTEDQAREILEANIDPDLFSDNYFVEG